MTNSNFLNDTQAKQLGYSSSKVSNFLVNHIQASGNNNNNLGADDYVTYGKHQGDTSRERNTDTTPRRVDLIEGGMDQCVNEEEPRDARARYNELIRRSLERKAAKIQRDLGIK